MLLGGSMGPVVWDVIGSELSLREHVARQAGVKRSRYTRHVAG